MNPFRSLLAVMFVVILGYTAAVTMRHGSDVFSVFFGDIASISWPGQFNLDFMMLLILTGLWVAWRHRFSPVGIALGLLASVGGVLFLSAYLLWASYQAKGDVLRIALGQQLDTRCNGLAPE